MATERQKRVRREAASQEAEVDLKRLDGRGRDLYYLRTGLAIENDRILTRHLKSDPTTGSTSRAVGPNELQGGAVRSQHIHPGQVTGGSAGADGKIAANTITAANVASNAITADELRSSTTTGSTARAVGGTEIKGAAVGSEHVADGNILNRHIGAGQVTASSIATNSITSAELRDSTDSTLRAVGNGHIKDSAVTNSRMGDNSVSSRVLADGSVYNLAIQASAVTQSKIRGSSRSGANDDTLRSVRNEHIGNDAVTRATVAAGTIGYVECSDLLKPENLAVSDAGFRRINNTVGAAAPYHVHSVLFKTWPKAERLRLLDVRGKLRGYREKPAPSVAELSRRVDSLCEVVEGLLRIETDDPGMDAWEIEGLLDRGGEEARRFKNAHMMDDWQYEEAGARLPHDAPRNKRHWRDVEASPPPPEVPYNVGVVRNFKHRLKKGSA